jgi:hypothetical protein
MIAVRDKTTKIVKYLFSDGENVNITETGMTAGQIKAVDIRSNSHEAVSAPNPGFFFGNMYSFDGTWVIANQSLYDAELEQFKIQKKADINTVRYSKIYMDSIPYTFPGDTEPDGIQMRDETDRQNIQDFITDATTSDPATEMTWMPVSNKPKTMTAEQAIAMGKALKARGDAIMAYSWQLKELVGAAETYEELQAIDIETGWPVMGWPS